MAVHQFNAAKYTSRIRALAADAASLGLYARYDLGLEADDATVTDRLRELPSLWRLRKAEVPVFAQFLTEHEANAAQLRDPQKRNPHRNKLRDDSLALLEPLRERARYAVDPQGRLDEESREALQAAFVSRGFEASLVTEVLAVFPAAPKVPLAEKHIGDQVRQSLTSLGMDLFTFLGITADAPLSEWQRAVHPAQVKYSNLPGTEHVRKNAGTRLCQLLPLQLTTTESHRGLLNRLGAGLIEERLLAAITSGVLTDERRRALAAEARSGGALDAEELVARLIRQAMARGGGARSDAESRAQMTLALQDLSAARLFAARAQIASVVALVPGLEVAGKTATQHLEEVEAKIEILTQRLREAAQVERANPDRAYEIYEDVLRQASDCEEARKGLESCPPLPPTSLEAKVARSSIQLQWPQSRSRGGITHRLLRKEGTAPTNPDDGTLLYEGPGVSFTDNSAAAGLHFHYAVSARRGSRWSLQSTATGPVTQFADVEGFVLEPGSRFIRGSWVPPAPSVKRVHVQRYDSDPRTATEAGKSLVVNGTEFLDDTVINDRVYYYRVVAEYRDVSGRPAHSRGVIEMVRPAQPPQPIQTLTLHPEAARVVIRWKAPTHGTVRIFRLRERPTWPVGTTMSIRELAALEPGLPSTSPIEAVDTLLESNLVYYLAASIAGDVAVIGRTQTFVHVGDVLELSAQHYTSYVQLQWAWPDDCDQALVTWRHDTFPTAPMDPHAERETVGQGTYLHDSGFQLRNPVQGPYYFTIFASRHLAGRRFHALGLTDGCHAAVRMRPTGTVRYEVRRPSLWRRNFTLTVQVEGGIETLPDFVIVAKQGRAQPVSIEHGIVLADLTGAAVPPNGKLSREFDLNGLPRPVSLRAFFCEPSAYEQAQLEHPAASQLMVE